LPVGGGCPLPDGDGRPGTPLPEPLPPT